MFWRAAPVGIPGWETQAGAPGRTGGRIPPAELGERSAGAFFDDDTPTVRCDVADLDATLSCHGNGFVLASGTISPPPKWDAAARM